MLIEIKRISKSGSCMIGNLSVDSVVLCKTLELPFLDNQSNISSIPAGEYTGILRYDHSDKWRIELTNVVNRTHIQIHIGNYPKDTKGCVLVGTAADSTDCKVTGSTSAFLDLKRSFYGTDFPTSTPNKSIRIILSD